MYSINTISGLESEKQLTIKPTETTVIFNKIDEAPVYELTIEGINQALENNRIAKYFSPKS